MTALSSFYLLFTCVVTFFFGIKGSLDLHMSTSVGLRPSWAYVLTVSVTTAVPRSLPSKLSWVLSILNIISFTAKAVPYGMIL